MTKLLPLLLILIAFTASLPAHAQSQMEMNIGAATDAEKSDKELTAIYKKIYSSLKDDPKAQALFKDAEDAWLIYRDKQAEYEAAQDIGGSIHSMTVSLAAKDLTEERIKYLKNLLKNN